jgi:acetyltransferase-like isoleucine patch superfamily enzyme
VERAHVARPHGGSDAAAVPAAAMSSAGADDGRLDAAFVELLRRDRGAFGALGSDFKVALYRRHGARIGAGCRIAEGSVLHVGRLVLGDGAVFGPGTTVEADELVAGRLLHFGARCRVRCRRLSFGDNAFLTDDVEIGGGGAMDPEAGLEVGSHGFVGEHVHLNTARRLAIGDEVIVSRGAVVMTHSFGPSWLQGYPSRFAGVSIGDGAQLGIGAVVYPGVEIGAGAVVLSGSSVVTSVPPGRLFGGVPAVDMKAAAQQLSPAEVAERAHALVQEFARQLQLRGFAVALARTRGGAAVTVTVDGSRHVLELAPADAFHGHGGAAESVQVAVAFPDEVWQRQPDGVTSIGLDPPRIRGPLGPLGGAFREFLRKRGVRLHPRAWAYTGGWL